MVRFILGWHKKGAAEFAKIANSAALTI